jgi:hypothetical protein
LGEDARCFLAAFVECVTVQANPPAQYRLNVAEGFLAEARQKPGRPARGPVSENGARSPVNKHCDVLHEICCAPDEEVSCEKCHFATCVKWITQDI